jgi:hypothetical protein
MTAIYSDKSLRGQPPGNYRIRVEGRLGTEWSDRLGGLQISTESEGTRSITMLSGPLIDQASLLGVVNVLYDLQLTILSVERLDDVTA